jgi:hypothetical protein
VRATVLQQERCYTAHKFEAIMAIPYTGIW